MKIDLKDRINYLIKFRPEKYSGGNNRIDEQTFTGPGGSINPFMEKPAPKPKDPNEYPNYCKYPEKAILPGKNEVGVSGLEGIPEGYCCYPIPMPKSKKGGKSYIFLPSDAKIEFWDQSEYFEALKMIKIPSNEINAHYEWITRICPQGTVSSFSLSSLNYEAWIEKERGDPWSNGWFYWYFTADEEKKPYPKIKWKDPRNDFQKIVDDYFDVIQIGASVGFLLAGFFTYGGTWLVWLEIFTEGTFAIAQGVRSYQKGDNIDVAFQSLFALAPFLKTMKFFKGFSSEAASSLIESMKNAGLTEFSTPEEIYRWYIRLGDSEKQLWKKIISSGDEFSEANLKRAFADAVEEMITFARQNPTRLKLIPWYKTVGAKEFGVQGLLQLLEVGCEIFYSEKLNDEEKLKLTTIYNNSKDVSKELADEVAINFLKNQSRLKEILNSDSANNYVKELSKKTGENIAASVLNYQNKKMFEDAGVSWEELDYDETEPLEDKIVDQEEIEKLLKQGYKKGDDLTDKEWEYAINPKSLNGIIYYQIKK